MSISDMKHRNGALPCELHNVLLASQTQYHAHLVGKRIWLACSGGRDSLSLAHACWQLFCHGLLPFLPQIIHVNHGVQSLNADWATHVERWCHTHDVPCHVLNLCQHFDSLRKTDEQSLRDARYQAIATLMNEGDVLMLAHHRDDQVETVLMRLFNGSGINGLAGISPWHTRKVELPVSHTATIESAFASKAAIQPNPSNVTNVSVIKKTIHLWRPWLAASRVDITAYAHARHLPYIDDPSNELTIQSQRNHTVANDLLGDAVNNDRAWLRSVLLPLLRQRFAQAEPAIARSAHLLADAKQRLIEQVQYDLTEVIQHDLSIEVNEQSWQSVLNIPKLKQLSTARQSAVVHHWLTKLTTKKSAPSLAITKQIVTLCHRVDPDQRTQIWHDVWLICRYRQQLFALQRDWFEWLRTPWQQGWKISTKSTTLPHAYADTKWQWQLSKACDAHRRQCMLAFSSRAIVALNLIADHCRIEPYVYTLSLQLFGRAGHKSGKKLLQTLGIPVFMRPSVLVVFYQHQPNKPTNVDLSNKVLSKLKFKVSCKVGEEHMSNATHQLGNGTLLCGGDITQDSNTQPFDEPILLISPMSVHRLQSTLTSELNADLRHEDVMQIYYSKR